jgi:hypothetical protein
MMGHYWPGAETKLQVPMNVAAVFDSAPISSYESGKKDGIEEERERLLKRIFRNEAARNTWVAMDELLRKLEEL